MMDSIDVQADEIYDFINELTRYKKYPKKMFGGYRELYQIVKSSKFIDEKERALNQLRMISLSIIPPNTKQKKMKVICNSIKVNTKGR